MKCFCEVLIALLVLGVVCQASPAKSETTENDSERDKRQMKGSSTMSIAPEQAEAKFIGGSLLTPLSAASNGAFQAGLPNGLMVQGTYGSLPGLGYGIPGGFFGTGGVPSPINSGGGIGTAISAYPSGVGSVGSAIPSYPGGISGGVGSSLTTYPSGFEMHPNYMHGSGFYPNAAGPFPQIGAGGPYGSLENSVNTHLIAQPSQIQPQISPFPFMPNYYPQMGFNPAFQNFQG